MNSISVKIFVLLQVLPNALLLLPQVAKKTNELILSWDKFISQMLFLGRSFSVLVKQKLKSAVLPELYRSPLMPVPLMLF